MKRLLENLKVRFYNWLSLDSQRCLAFGGVSDINIDGSVDVRLCTKNRWHIDSHMYEFEQLRIVYRKGRTL